MNDTVSGGDAGETSLCGGERVPKDDARVEACGAVDELNAFVGLVMSRLEGDDLCSLLGQVQQDLFCLGADIATPEGIPARSGTPIVSREQVADIEEAIGRLGAELPPIRSFLLPEGTEGATILQVARTVCRRAERRVVTLGRLAHINPEIQRYLNRLSDLLFLLARTANSRAGVQERAWKP